MMHVSLAHSVTLGRAKSGERQPFSNDFRLGSGFPGKPQTSQAKLYHSLSRKGSYVYGADRSLCWISKSTSVLPHIKPTFWTHLGRKDKEARQCLLSPWPHMTDPLLKADFFPTCLTSRLVPREFRRLFDLEDLL